MEINRREFMKLLGVSAASAAAGVWAANAVFSVPDEVFDRVHSGPHLETWKNSICTLCPGGCGIRVRQIDGIPVRVLGNPFYPVNRGGVCPKAESGIEMLFHPDRIQKPLKRAGERGENKWQVIDWDETLQIISNRLQKLREDSTPERFVMITRDNNEVISDLCDRFMAVYGSPNHLCLKDSGIQSLPGQITQGINTTPYYDIANSNYVLNFGADFLDEGPSPIRYNQLYVDLRHHQDQQRTKIVHISSYMSRTAANSSEWIPVKPGTMAALALAIAHVMVRDVSYDKDFIRDESFGFSSWQDSMGISHQGFKDLVIKEYYPEKAAEITGVPAEKIVEIARNFASTDPALALAGGQAAESTNSLYTLWAIYCLNALKGNLEKEGGVYFPEHSNSLSLIPETADEVARTGLAQQKIGRGEDFKFVNPLDSIGQLLDSMEENQPYPIDTIIIHDVNPIAESLNVKRFIEAIKNIPFIVSSASFMNDTARYSDLILPKPVFLECWEASRNVPSIGFAHLGIQQPVIDPLHDTRHIGDILLSLKQNLGDSIATSLPWNDYASYLKLHAKEIFDSGQGTVISESMDLSWIEFLKQRGWQAFEYFNFEEFWTVLIERGGWWDPLTDKTSSKTIFKNNSGKFEFFALTVMEKIKEQLKVTDLNDEKLDNLCHDWNILARGDLIFLPHFENPRFLEDSSDYPYHLLPYTILSNYGTPAPVGLLNEMFGLYSREYWNSWVEINPRTAMGHNLAEDDRVRIVSANGQISLKVKILPSVMPDTIMLPLAFSGNSIDIFSSDTDLLANISSRISTKVKIEKLDDEDIT